MIQISEDEMFVSKNEDSNTVAILIKHISGNMKSRFTDFLTTDGEKSWRNRDGEFTSEKWSREKLMGKWEDGWQCLLDVVEALSPSDLKKQVLISGEINSVIRALQRQLVHYAYHTGQIVYICKEIRSIDFQTLSIPKKKPDN